MYALSPPPDINFFTFIYKCTQSPKQYHTHSSAQWLFHKWMNLSFYSLFQIFPQFFGSCPSWLLALLWGHVFPTASLGTMTFHPDISRQEAGTNSRSPAHWHQNVISIKMNSPLKQTEVQPFEIYTFLWSFHLLASCHPLHELIFGTWNHSFLFVQIPEGPLRSFSLPMTSTPILFFLPIPTATPMLSHH